MRRAALPLLALLSLGFAPAPLPRRGNDDAGPVVVARMTHQQALRVAGQRRTFVVRIDPGSEFSSGARVGFDVAGRVEGCAYWVLLRPVDARRALGGEVIIEGVLRVIYHDAKGKFPRRVQYVIDASR
jgi:hypothetical protein